MAVKLSSLKANLTREAAGDFIEIPDLPGVSLKVRSFNYKPFQIARDALVRKLNKKFGSKPWDPDESAVAFGEIYAEHILTDWTGFDETYSAELAHETLTDPAGREMRAHVVWAATKVAEVDVEFVEAAGKNFAPSSATA